MLFSLINIVVRKQYKNISFNKFSSSKFGAGWWQIKKICVWRMGGMILRGERGKKPCHDISLSTI
jgi:hypothetical protein